MEKVIIKIVAYDESTNSVLVKFKDQNDEKNIDDYPSYAFQPNINDTFETFINNVSRSGVDICKRQKDIETLMLNNPLIENIKLEINKDIAYDVVTYISNITETQENAKIDEIKTIVRTVLFEEGLLSE